VRFLLLFTVLVAASMAAGWFGQYLTSTALTIPICEEDEVVLHNGNCHPLDEAIYDPRLGWVPEFGTVPHW
jgi:hypothetical protein